MAWRDVTIGGIVFREELLASDQPNGLTIGGQESHPPSPRGDVYASHHNVRGMRGLLVPVVFEDKSELSGFYVVESSRSDLMDYANGAIVSSTWEATLAPVGGGRDIELESNVPRVPRIDELPGTQNPVYWHAPPVGAAGYLTGPTVPASSVDRVSSDGTVRVHLGIPVDAPRWTIDVADYLGGSARLLLDGYRRVGTATPDLSAWEINNGLVRVAGGDDGRILVSCWNPASAGWRSERPLVLSVNDVVVDLLPELTVLSNEPEEVRIRLTYPTTPGRLTLDLSLRRGARTVSGTIKRHSAAALTVTVDHGEADTAVTGGIRATTADAFGNRFVLGSAMTATTGSAPGSLRKAAVLRFDFFAGHEIGASPAAGDAFADLLAQYLGSSSERVRVVAR